MRRISIEPWPFPGESREERAKTVARSYRKLLFAITQGQCTDPAGELYRLDQRWLSHGVHWLQSTGLSPLDGVEWMSAQEIAHALDRPRKDIYNWARLGHIEQRAAADGSPQYNVESVVDYHKKLRARRIPTPRRSGETTHVSAK